MLHQVNIWGKTNLENSLELIRENEPPSGYVVSFSGGKDSIVLKDLVIRSGVKAVFVYSFTGIDPPEMVQYIREHHKDVNFVRGDRTFWDLIVWSQGYPTSRTRWCCRHLKERPVEKFMPSLKIRLNGIRAEESSKRKARGQFNQFKEYLHIAPLFYWREGEIWDYIEENKLPYCKLYDEGFSRVGCTICPCRSGLEFRLSLERWPKFFRLFDKCVDLRLQRRPNKRFGSKEAVLEWWYDR